MLEPVENDPVVDPSFVLVVLIVELDDPPTPPFAPLLVEFFELHAPASAAPITHAAPT